MIARNKLHSGIPEISTMPNKELKTYCPASRQEWRQWLADNHRSEQSVWLVYYKKNSHKPTVTYQEAVEEALCFGWIDSTKKTMDEERFMQLFSRRKAASVWSRINKEKIRRLMDEGLMTGAGLESIEKAKKNGSWTILDDVEDLKVPEDLEEAFNNVKGTMDFFLSLSRSDRKAILQWLVLARKVETRQRRISEIVELAAQKLKPKQFR